MWIAEWDLKTNNDFLNAGGQGFKECPCWLSGRESQKLFSPARAVLDSSARSSDERERDFVHLPFKQQKQISLSNNDQRATKQRDRERDFY